MTPDERQRLEKVEAMLGMLIATERYTFQKHLQLLDGRNIILGKGTGTKFGTETTQKIGFFNKTPIVQPSAISAPSGGSVADAIDSSARSKINDIRTALTNLGLTA